MSGGPEFRKAAPGDLDAILAIEAAWPTTPKWSRTHFEREIAGERSYICVCIVSPSAMREGRDRVAAYGGLRLLPPEAQVTTLAVRPDLARRGLGRRMMEHLHGQAVRAGCTQLSLEVSAANQAALRLYESLGYRIVGRRPKYYNDGSDAVLMNARLDELAA